MSTSLTERTPSIGFHEYLSCGNSFARPRNFVWRLSRSAMNDDLRAATDSFVMTSCADADEGAAAIKAAAPSARVATRMPGCRERERKRGIVRLLEKD